MKTSRRRFFAAIGGVLFMKMPGLAKRLGIKAPFSDRVEWLSPEDLDSGRGFYQCRYKGYLLSWTGLRKDPNDSAAPLAGQWCAYGRANSVGFYNGYHANCLSMSWESIEQREYSKELTLGKLLRAIDLSGIDGKKEPVYDWLERES